MELTLIATRDCNLRCAYCYTGEKVYAAMDFETARQGMDLVFNAHQGDSMQGLHFFGGEPLLNWDLMVQADEYFTGNWGGGVVRKSVTTNGTLLTPERADWLASRGYYIGLSMDGAEASHDRFRSFADGRGSFQTILNHGLYMIQKKYKFKTIIVVNPENLGRLYRDVIFLYRQGFTELSLNLNTAAHWNQFRLGRLRRVYRRILGFYLTERRKGNYFYINVFDGKMAVLKAGGYQAKDHCQMGHKEVTLSPSGKFYPCERFVGQDDNEDVQIGDIITGLDPERISYFRHPKKLEECEVCEYRPYCVNWCGCTNYTTTGVWDEVSGVQCRYEQMLINLTAGMIIKQSKTMNFKK